MTETIIDGIEWFTVGDDWEECQCARCGSSAQRALCWNCGGSGKVEVESGDDTDWGRYEERECEACHGVGGHFHCISTPEYCEANPMPGREGIQSTAMNAEAWRDTL